MSKNSDDHLEFKMGGDDKIPKGFEKEENCFMQIERVGDLLNSPGMIQYEIEIHPKFGPKVQEITKAMLHAAVDGVDFSSSGPSDEAIDVLARNVGLLHAVYIGFLSDEIAEACVAMQVLGMKKLILSVETFDKATHVDPAVAARLAKRVSADGNSMLAAKPHPALAKIIHAGIMLSGGTQEKFAERQISVMNRLPELARKDPNASLPAQICGGVLEMLSERVSSNKNVSAALVGIMESVLQARRFSSFGLIADWNSKTENVIASVMSMAQRVITDRCDDKTISKNVAEDAIEKMMKQATQPGNETKH